MSHEIAMVGKDEPTQTMPTGPAGIENDKVDAMDGNSPMILKAIAKT
jgi:hypothetical protein